MKFFKLYLILSISLLVLVACGNETSSLQEDTTNDTNNVASEITSSEKALNNVGVIVEKEFKGYILKVLSSKKLSENEEISFSTIAVYGVINSDHTKALLKINTNYKGSTIIVNVYKGSEMVGASKPIIINDQIGIDFGQIIID